MPDLPIYVTALAISGGVFLALWPVSLWLRDVGVVDAWWGPGFGVAVGAVWFLAGGPVDTRALLVLFLVAAWSVRLSFVMVRRWRRHDGEDRRYRLIRKGWGASFWWKSLFIVFVLQGFLQWVVALGAMGGLLASPTPIGPFAVLGTVLALIGLAVETIADAELDAFKRSAPEGALMTTGLRAHVRHPNYSGEMIFWWGVWLTVAPIAPWWAVVSPVVLTILLTRVSGAPMLAETLGTSRPEFAGYANRTPAFIPRPFANNQIATE